MACKYLKQKRQVSYDSGTTWIDVTPAEYQRGELYEINSPDCEDYSTKYLTFIPTTTSATFTWKAASGAAASNTVSYTLDGGNTWATLSSGQTTPSVAAGQKIMWKANGLNAVSGDAFYNGDVGIGKFIGVGSAYDVEGNIMSLVSGDSFMNATVIPNDYQFMNLFCGASTGYQARDASNLVLPATSLRQYCYAFMFLECNYLEKAPKILPATTLSKDCYTYMFGYCSRLTTAPQLPATTLAENCYIQMFYNCTSLTTAPALPAITLANKCYESMFAGCTGLTTAPSLSANTLTNLCYWGMFSGCTSLNSVTCLATNISAQLCTKAWLKNVSSTGTFTKASSMSSWTSGDDGIPNNWAVQNYY